MALIYNASFNSGTRVLSLLDKAGNVISSCEVPSKSNELTLTATADNSSVTLNKVGTLSNTYEVNVGSGWTAYTFGTVINLNNGQSCKWRCSAHPTTQSDKSYVKFVMTGTIGASGNCTSMLSSIFENITSLSGYNFAFYGLFNGCSSLTQAPALPITTLATNCYTNMFNGCTSLTQAPALPATTLVEWCYNYMFYGCTSLTQAPELPATNLQRYCYNNMFNGCSALNEVRIAATTTATNALTSWLDGVAATGDFYCDPNATIFLSGGSGIPVGWGRWVYGATDTGNTTTMYHNGVAETVRVGTSSYGACYALQSWAGFKTLAQMHEAGYTFGVQTAITMYYYDSPVSSYSCAANIDDGFTETMYDVGNGQGYLTIAQQNANDYYLTATPYTGLTLTATANNSSVKLTKVGTLSNTFEVNTGNGWQSYTFGTIINLNVGQSCKWRCSAHPTTQSSSNSVQFVMAGTIEASGNYNSMLSSDFENIASLSGYDFAFNKLFQDCTALTKVPELPATTLARGCYSAMFKGCTALTKAPNLPSTTLASNCYQSMFFGCTALTKAPELPATILSAYCYYYMFEGCTSLTDVRIAATDISATRCLTNWLSNVVASGDFYYNPNTNFPTDSADGIPQNWNRFVLGAEDTETTTTMYHNGSTETVRVGTSSYGTCYSAQSWAGFKLLAGMHEAGYTFGSQSSITMYHNGSTETIYKVDANVADGFTEDMYILNGAYKTLTQMHNLGYTLQAPVPTTMYYAGAATSIDKIEANGADGFTEDMYRVNGNLQTLAQAHTSGYTLGAQSSLTMYYYDSPVSALSVAANAEDGFTETMYAVGGKSYLTIAQQNANDYYLTPTPYAGLTFTAVSSNSTVRLVQNGKVSNTYQVNTGSGWSTYTFGNVISLKNIGDKCRWRCDTFNMQQNVSNFVKFDTTGYTDASGNCLSMVNKNFDAITGVPPYAFYHLFYNCMNLTRAPELPVTGLAPYCYSGMFYGCTRLAKAPALPATTLADYCYQVMFNGCTALNEVRIAAITSATGALASWLYNVYASGDFYCDPNATIFPADNASGIPSGWTRHALADYPNP